MGITVIVDILTIRVLINKKYLLTWMLVSLLASSAWQFPSRKRCGPSGKQDTKLETKSPDFQLFKLT